MPISLEHPISSEPVAAVVYDSCWISNITINAPSPSGAVAVNIIVVPLKSSTGELYDDGKKIISINDVMTEVQTNQSLEQAMGAILVAVNNLIKTRSIF